VLVAVVLYSLCIIQSYFLVVKLFLVHMREINGSSISWWISKSSILKQESQLSLEGPPQSCPQGLWTLRDSLRLWAPQCTPQTETIVSWELPPPLLPSWPLTQHQELETVPLPAQSPALSLYPALVGFFVAGRVH
jgi:hypothetical protein